jgi:hypothetical protein
MLTLPGKQRGLTFISLIILLGVIGFFVLLILKIGPIYMNHAKVVNALDALEATDNLTSMSQQQIITSLDKRFNLNYVENVSHDDITIVSKPGYVKVNIDYERIEPIIGNLSVLVEFHEGFESGSK